MIIVHVTYKANGKANLDGYLQEITQHNVPALSRAESGCHQYDFFTGAEAHNHGSLFLLEQWEDQAALDFHLNSAHYKSLQPIKDKWGIEMQAQRFEV